MNTLILKEAQARYESHLELSKLKKGVLHKLRNDFVDKFPVNGIKNLQLDEYIEGKNKESFCYRLERELSGLGKIVGARADKFGVYYGKMGDDLTKKYRHSQKFGSDYKSAFINVKSAIYDLLIAGKKEDINSIISNPISPMFKGKILSTYFPDHYLPIFSNEHLIHYLTHLNLDTEKIINSNEVLKREELLKFKDSDPVMKNWSVEEYYDFLIHFIGPPPKTTSSANPSDPLKDFREPAFPPNPIPVYIDLKIQPNTPTTSKKTHQASSNKNPDYEKENRLNKKLGDRGEKIVKDAEIKRLNDLKKHHLAVKVKNTGQDFLGYDILSYDDDGTERYIEVKATRAKPGNANFFLTSNELNQATITKNYWIYIIFDILSNNPKIWPIQNPFNPENKEVIKTPVNYRIDIKAK